MGTRLIVQPDGQFGFFSTVSDSIWALNCDEEEIIRLWKERAAERAEEEIKDWLAEARGEKWGPENSRMTLAEALKENIDQHIHNKELLQLIKDMRSSLKKKKK